MKISKALNGTLQLLDDEDDRYAVMMGVTATTVASFAQSISHGSEAFETLTPDQRLLVVMGMIMTTLGGVPSMREIPPEVVKRMTAAERSYPKVIIG